MVSDRGVGENWAMLGDSFGFVDPVFSSGLLIAFNSAEELAKAIQNGSPKALENYSKFVGRNITAWQEVIEHFLLLLCATTLLTEEFDEVSE